MERRVNVTGFYDTGHCAIIRFFHFTDPRHGSTGTSRFTVKVTGWAGDTATASLSTAIAAREPLTSYEFTGDTTPVHDPSIIGQGTTYYVFATDASPESGYIPILARRTRLRGEVMMEGSCMPCTSPERLKTCGCAGHMVVTSKIEIARASSIGTS